MPEDNAEGGARDVKFDDLPRLVVLVLVLVPEWREEAEGKVSATT